jgi:threonine dehydratase
MRDLTFSLIQEAVQVLNGVAHFTPVTTSRTMDETSRARAFLKCENFQRTGALDAMESVKQNCVVPMANPGTIADGLRTSVGDRTLPILSRHLTGFFVVEEWEILRAMRFAYERLKFVIEPSSAVALAPLLRKETQLEGKRVAVVLTGGNVDFSLLWKDLSEEMSRS